ncbi:hypothetical protein SLE2022_236020 [Rubroshorea leprosula]
MGRKRPPIVEPLPVSSSEVEEEEHEEEAAFLDNDAVHEDDEHGNDSIEEDDSEMEEEEKNADSDAESDSDRSLPSPNVSDFTIKPIVPKRNKKPSASSASTGDEKTTPFQRVWSEEDELAILKGMIEYKSKKGTDTYADIGGFHDFIKKTVRADVSQNQLKDKIRRLKKKYENNVDKGVSAFTKLHDEKAFRLSKKIWGLETRDSGKSKKKAKVTNSNDQDKGQVNGSLTLGLAARKDKDAKVVGIEENAEQKVDEKHEENVEQRIAEKLDEKHVENDDIWKNYPYLRESLEVEQTLGMPDILKNFLREKLGLIPREKVRDIESKWRKLKQDELQLYLDRIELVKEQTQLALDWM